MICDEKFNLVRNNTSPLIASQLFTREFHAVNVSGVKSDGHLLLYLSESLTTYMINDYLSSIIDSQNSSTAYVILYELIDT